MKRFTMTTIILLAAAPMAPACDYGLQLQQMYVPQVQQFQYQQQLYAPQVQLQQQYVAPVRVQRVRVQQFQQYAAPVQVQRIQVQRVQQYVQPLAIQQKVIRQRVRGGGSLRLNVGTRRGGVIQRERSFLRVR